MNKARSTIVQMTDLSFKLLQIPWTWQICCSDMSQSFMKLKTERLVCHLSVQEEGGRVFATVLFAIYPPSTPATTNLLQHFNIGRPTAKKAERRSPDENKSQCSAWQSCLLESGSTNKNYYFCCNIHGANVKGKQGNQKLHLHNFNSNHPPLAI